MKFQAISTCLFASLAMSAAQIPADDVILRSMRDELERSRKLAISNLEQPYYIEYSVDDVTGYTGTASLGAIVSEVNNRFRIPRVRVRVGDYNFDNTNYVLADFFGGNAEPLTIDDNYGVLRRGWWLATDRAYKGALEAIARKRAAVKHLIQPEELPDFAKAEPVTLVEPGKLTPVDPSPLGDKIRSLSMVFAAYPEILSSHVGFSRSRAVSYMHNSEGTVIRRPEPLTHLQVHAMAYAADGSIVRDARSIPAIVESALPGDAELRQATASVAENLRALVKAPVGESYNGPVLFEGLAGAQIMAELLAPNLAAARRPVTEPGRGAPFLASEFEGRMDVRVLPSFLDVVDDPTQKSWNNVPLVGHYNVDGEGVVPKPVTVIEKGRLKSFLTTRQPVKDSRASNGRARVPGTFGASAASVSNLFIRSSESMKGAELKGRLIKMAADRGKPYGILVRRMDFPSGASIDDFRKMATASGQSGATRPVSAPVLVYKVFPDGREELVRGLRFRGLSARSLRDIVAVSEELSVLHYLNNLAPMALLSMAGYVAPVSVVAPSVLFDELEMERPRDDVPSLPVVPPPPLSESAALR